MHILHRGETDAESAFGIVLGRAIGANRTHMAVMSGTLDSEKTDNLSSVYMKLNSISLFPLWSGSHYLYWKVAFWHKKCVHWPIDQIY